MNKLLRNLTLFRQHILLLQIELHHPLAGINNPKFMLLHFLTAKSFCKEKKALAFN
jgi:hypothetical protein